MTLNGVMDGNRQGLGYRLAMIGGQSVRLCQDSVFIFARNEMLRNLSFWY